MTEALGHRETLMYRRWRKFRDQLSLYLPANSADHFMPTCALLFQRQQSAQRDEARRPGCSQTKGRVLAPVRRPAAAAAARWVSVRQSIA